MKNSSAHGNITSVGLQFPSSHLPIFLAICALEAFAGVILNYIVIVVILRHRQLRKLPSSLLAINFALTDLVSSAICLPLHAAMVWEGHWITTNKVTHKSLFIFASMSSAFAIKAITIDRYVGVVYSLRYQAIVTHRKAKIGTVLTWALSAILTITFFIAEKMNALSSYQTFLSALAVLMVVIMFTLNLSLYWKSRKHARKICVQLSVVALRARITAKRQLGLAKSARKVVVILALYFVTFAPIIISRRVLGEKLESKEFYHWMLLVFRGTSCINPLVYAFWNRHFRQIMKM